MKILIFLAILGLAGAASTRRRPQQITTGRLCNDVRSSRESRTDVIDTNPRKVTAKSFSKNDDYSSYENIGFDPNFDNGPLKDPFVSYENQDINPEPRSARRSQKSVQVHAPSGNPFPWHLLGQINNNNYGSGNTPSPLPPPSSPGKTYQGRRRRVTHFHWHYTRTKY